MRPAPPVAKTTAFACRIEISPVSISSATRRRSSPSCVADQVERHPLDEELRVRAHVLLVERVQHRVAGAVGRGARAHRIWRCRNLRVAAERTLVDLAVLEAVERHAHVLELDHHLDRAAAHVFDRVLVAEVVGALDRVVHVPVPVVLGAVAERRRDAALRGHGMGARREHLGQYCGVQVAARELERRAHAGAAGADHDRIEPADTV